MLIVLATRSLAGLGGSETYALTVADHLQRLGHDVWLLTGELGEGSQRASRLGVRVVTDASAIVNEPSVVLVQEAEIACELAESLPLVPQVFVAHSDIFDHQLPPQLPGLIQAVVVLYDRVERRVRALSHQAPIHRLTQPIDVELFKPTTAPRKEPRVALALGNYLHGGRLDILRRACTNAKIELRHIGGHAGHTTMEPESALNEADIVFGKARVLLEAMACGRAAYVLDHNGAEGWVTAENQSRLSADNFGGQSDPIPITLDGLARDLVTYDADMGLVNRDFVVAHHSATKHAAELVQILRRVAPRSIAVEAPLNELARMIRLNQRYDMTNFTLAAQLETQSAQIAQLEHRNAELESEAAELKQRHARLEDDAAHLTAELARSAERLQTVAASRRWRAVQVMMAPADRLRTRKR